MWARRCKARETLCATKEAISPRGAEDDWRWLRYHGPPTGIAIMRQHASTVEEGVAQGRVDVIRSTGAANLMNSEAADRNFDFPQS